MVETLAGLGPTALVLVLIAGITTGLATYQRLDQPWLQPWAIIRATVQLALLSLVLSGAIESLLFTHLFVAFMILVASLTIRQRLNRSYAALPRIYAVVVIAISAPIALVFATGALPFEGRYLLALGGILTGHAMIASSLMGKQVNDALVTHVAEIEGWLALGAPMRVATREVMRKAGSLAIIAGTDQTRNIGVVTLPGAFVGAVFGGANVLEAGRFQLIVSSSILLVGMLVVLMWSYVLGNPSTLKR